MLLKTLAAVAALSASSAFAASGAVYGTPKTCELVQRGLGPAEEVALNEPPDGYFRLDTHGIGYPGTVCILKALKAQDHYKILCKVADIGTQPLQWHDEVETALITRGPKSARVSIDNGPVIDLGRCQ